MIEENFKRKYWFIEEPTKFKETTWIYLPLEEYESIFQCIVVIQQTINRYTIRVYLENLSLSTQTDSLNNIKEKIQTILEQNL